MGAHPRGEEFKCRYTWARHPGAGPIEGWCLTGELRKNWFEEVLGRLFHQRWNAGKAEGFGDTQTIQTVYQNIAVSYAPHLDRRADPQAAGSLDGFFQLFWVEVKRLLGMGQADPVERNFYDMGIKRDGLVWHGRIGRGHLWQNQGQPVPGLGEEIGFQRRQILRKISQGNRDLGLLGIDAGPFGYRQSGLIQQGSRNF